MMPFAKLPQHRDYPQDPDILVHPPPPTRPKFNHQNTIDRLREGTGTSPSFPMVSKIRKDRKSMFKELGLDTDEPVEAWANEKEFGELTGLTPTGLTPTGTDQPPWERGKSDERISEPRTSEDESNPPRSPAADVAPPSPTNKQRWLSRLVSVRRPKIKVVSSAPPSSLSSLSRLATIVLLIAVVIPGFSHFSGREQLPLHGADAGVINPMQISYGPFLETRQDSPTQICTRWSQQTALLNGTLYIYGGQAKSSSSQTDNTWNNDFLTLDLTKTWDASSAPLSGLPQPSGPPAVSNGYLWNDYNNLYLYGGEFADNPYVQPAPISTWKYDIGSKSWIEYPSPKTSAGNNSDPGNVPVQRAAEGAGLSVPELGVSWYFGGHLDLATTPGWSNQIARVYLKSLLEFTHPGYTNDGVYDLAMGSGAGDGGVYRNITQGGLQTDSGFSERADGVLVFVPGWGTKGVLIGLAGGTADTFSNDLSTLDVYDIASSTWYHQKTSGTPPSVRVNPCAVVASAPDASSFQIYLYGGQNLQPYKEQTQYSDMFILTIPSFTWIEVSQSGDPKPAGRAGHTCNLRDGQIVLVGGYVGTSIPCDSPGIYIFNASSLQWTSSFTALDHPADLDPGNSILANSFGYMVPDVVVSAIGGNSGGSATATTPAVGPATGGPFATGKPPVFTITAAGSTATITQGGPGSTGITGGGGGGSSSGSSNSDDRKPSLIAAGVIAGLAGLAAAYLGFCAWLYRRQVRAYKTHLAVANRYSGADGKEDGTPRLRGLGGFAALFGRKRSTGSMEAAAGAGEKSQRWQAGHRREISAASSAGSFEWMPPTEPKMMFDDQPTPDSGYSGQYSTGTGTGTGSVSQAGSYGPKLDATGQPLWPTGSGFAAGQATASSGSGAAASGSGLGSANAATTPARQGSRGSQSSTEGLLDGQEPNFFSVVMGPRRALRVVNGLESMESDNDAN